MKVKSKTQLWYDLGENVSLQHLIVILPNCGKYRPHKSMPVYTLPYQTLLQFPVDFTVYIALLTVACVMYNSFQQQNV